MRRRVVIIGAGLGGCFLARGLLDRYSVTMIELADIPPLLRDRVSDVAHPAETYPHIESGLGGTTKAWHNALMEIDAPVFDRVWPYRKDELERYYERAYLMLSGLTREHVRRLSDELRSRLVAQGFPGELLGQHMFIPAKRINAWDHLGLKDRVEVIEGEAIKLSPASNGEVIAHVVVRNQEGECLKVGADYFFLAAGGLGTPLLLQDLAGKVSSPGLRWAGYRYEDHPVCFVGEVVLTKPLYKFWNYPAKTSTGNASIRIPFAMYFKNLNISFQLRPAHHLKFSKPREKIISVLTEIRNFPLRPINYWRLLSQADDICDILSFKFGFRIPTRNYSILMVAEQPSSAYRAVWKEDNGRIIRRWEFGAEYIDTINEALDSFLKSIGPVVSSARIFSNWPSKIYSSSHHSGTARISGSPEDGVINSDGRVHGLRNLYVCDGSAIPGSGFVNTGLTIAALAMKLADHFHEMAMGRVGSGK